jgi:iron(III) transport system ATP-binding protein
VLLLDEPLSNLDAKLRIQMRHELLALQRKLSITTIFVTHDQEEANTIADRIALMKDGVIQQDGTPVELYDKPLNRFVADFLGTANFFEGKLERSDGKWLFQADNGLAIPLVDNDDSRKPGSCCLVFRPQNVNISAKAEDMPADTIQLRGAVSSREFLGSTIRYMVNIRDDRVFADVTHQQGRLLLEIGTDVDLYIQRDLIMVVNI